MELNWLDILYKVFEVALVPILGAVSVYLVSLINAKKQELLRKAKDETTKKYIEMLDETITQCVLATHQTYVEAIKNEGTFDLEAQKKAFRLTYDAVLAVLSDDAMEYLSEAVKDVNAYITTKIEAQVSLTKQIQQ